MTTQLEITAGFATGKLDFNGVEIRVGDTVRWTRVHENYVHTDGAAVLFGVVFYDADSSVMKIRFRNLYPYVWPLHYAYDTEDGTDRLEVLRRP